MNDDILNSLRTIPAPAVDAEKKARAIVAATMAFEADRKKVSEPAKGTREQRRQSSIFDTLKGTIMDRRWMYGLSTAAVCIVAAPAAWNYLGDSLTSSYALDSAAVSSSSGFGSPSSTGIGAVARPRGDQDASTAAERTVQGAPASAQMDQELRIGQAVDFGGSALPTVRPAPAPSTVSSSAIQRPIAPMPRGGAAVSVQGAPSMMMESMRSMPVMPHDPYVVPPQQSGDVFTPFDETQVKSTASDPVSTFSVDVDTASYAYARTMLRDGMVPTPEAIRIEEMINYFPYDYARPTDRSTPFASKATVFPAPWDEGKQLLHISVAGYETPIEEAKPSNLVFLIDTSGSMNEPSKLPLLKRAFGLLVDRMTAEDSIAIVAYAGSAGVVLEPTRGDRKAEILGALDRLSAGGGTAGSEGIELAYRLAEEAKVDGINRVILATDGDFNLGISEPGGLEKLIRSKRSSGTFLSVLGFGTGNYGDDTMQALAQEGNGNASYISDFTEARKVLVEEVGGTLETIAKDVKIQIEFNPAVVSEYRLIGYETRALANQDFNNDKVDAGDIGSGHTVTAIYEITPVGSASTALEPLRYGKPAAPAPDLPVEAGAGTNEIAFVKLRYKLPDEDVSSLVEYPVQADRSLASIDAADDDVRFSTAVAAFAQKLKGSVHADMAWEEVRALASGARGEDEGGYRSEFLRLVDDASSLLGR